jgi:vacuolar iron transporter family protein
MKVNQKTARLWTKHLQDEIDAAFLYRTLVELVKDEKEKDIYNRLAHIEDKHISIWLEQFDSYEIHKPELNPSLKARLIAIYSKKIGSALLVKLQLKEEANEVKSYLGLYRSSSVSSTKNIALKLAKDSAGHAGTLMESRGIKEEPWHSSEAGGLLRNIVYGFNDGLTANFGLIAGMIGASSAPHIILISGIAGVVADSLSMGSSGYLAAVSEKEVFDYEKQMEREEIRLMPELEAEELAVIYESKGMNRVEAQSLANEVIKNPEQALEEKVREELGIVESNVSPIKEGWITGTATAFGAFIPLLPFMFLSGSAAIWTSFIISMVAHFGVGAARSHFTGRGIFRSGFDMFIVGFGVAAIGYLIGDLIIKLF